VAGVNKWVAGARPRTLPAAVVPVVVGTAAAVGQAPSGIIWWRAAAALVVALAIQIGTNYANDYSDGVRGTDRPGTRTGPVRLVGSGLAAPATVKRAALLSFLVAAVAGLALAIAVDPWLLAVGAASFAAGWFYTGGPKPYGYLGLGELFVFVFFGLVATVFSTYVQTESISGLAVGAGAIMGFMATALLVANNLRDIRSDAATGKRTLAVRLGDRRTRGLYVALVVCSFGSIVGVSLGADRPWGLLGLAALPIAVRPVRTVLAGAVGPALIPVLVDTGRVQLGAGLLFAAGLALSG
jgi:1,4-dihydroxy-2-naphthoate octaprenyltransferase